MTRVLEGAEDWEARVRREIEAVIRYGLEAVRRRDIDRYMEITPPGKIFERANGQRLGRNELREETLRQWSYVVAMLEVHMEIESLELIGDDQAVVYTRQRYHRVVRDPESGRLHEIYTTARHRGRWERLPLGWRCVLVIELDSAYWLGRRPYLTDS